ncbi:MAG: glycogen/starch/alpha-glucan phosphorylase [Gemmataceae bacterium]|nr:glycogen/starch/alpha-glucan phosphorylase [Gemmataceae bacterium]
MTKSIVAPAAPAQAALRDFIRERATHSLETLWEYLLPAERFRAFGLALRDRLVDAAIATHHRYQSADAKTVYYLSMEFLVGRSLANNLVNLGLHEPAAQALSAMDQDLGELAEEERDAALGNGGLGRLAACFLDSLATLGMPAWGFGIRYEYGLFRQDIRDGRQVERADGWLTNGSPWLVERPERAVPVHLYGRVVNGDSTGGFRPKWVDGTTVFGVPHDMPIAGYGGQTVNLLRLFSAQARRRFDMQAFNEGHFFEAVGDETRVETIHKVLYPNDAVERGPELRLVQEYFLVACAVATILGLFERRHNDLARLPEKAAIQLNDTHPALTVAELMRVLVDEREMAWDRAWELTTATCAYTNHTLMPEALEKWPVPLFARVLPRHLDIVYEINRRHLAHVERSFPGDAGRVQRMSLIEEGQTKHVRMAHLAIVGSHSVNGVAAVHSELVKTSLVPDFYALTPEKFNNKTNGVTPRRWLLVCNPGLARLLTEAVGDGWVTDMGRLRGLERFADDAGFRERFLAVKGENKRALARFIQEEDGVAIDDEAMLDVQVKRIHLYKRQLLNALRVAHDYLRLVEDGEKPAVPRTYLFAGKAAPGYAAAKEVIYLLNCLADLVNGDRRAEGAMRVVFARDYRVTLAERIVPAADLSEQISTAGTEASGTSNMKFAMNGALTIGTLDGANIEIRDEVGPENLFIFGNTVDQVRQLQAEGRPPRSFYDNSAVVRRVLDAFRGDLLSPGAPGKFGWVFRALVEQGDPYFHLADLEAYLAAQEEAARLYQDRHAWARKAILNVARVGKFSSDRTIAEYAREIWEVAPVPG